MKKEQVLVNPDEVVKAFNDADEQGKELLKKFFNPFLPKKITDVIKTFEDACDYLKIGYDLPDVSKLLKSAQESQTAYYKLTVITLALNEGEELAPRDYRYWIWWDIASAAGFGFYSTDSTDGYTYANVGSRLCFRTAELAEYSANQFKEIWKDYMIYK